METWQDLGARVAVAALDKALLEFSVDRSRVYLTGLSMGGNGKSDLAYRHADRFAALVVVCGWISQRRNAAGTAYPGIAPSSAPDVFADVARRVASLQIWLFHGSADQVVPVEESRRMYAALKAVGADVQYTELPGVGHNAWTPRTTCPSFRHGYSNNVDRDVPSNIKNWSRRRFVIRAARRGSVADVRPTRDKLTNQSEQYALRHRHRRSRSRQDHAGLPPCRRWLRNGPRLRSSHHRRKARTRPEPPAGTAGVRARDSSPGHRQLSAPRIDP